MHIVNPIYSSDGPADRKLINNNIKYYHSANEYLNSKGISAWKALGEDKLERKIKKSVSLKVFMDIYSFLMFHELKEVKNKILLKKYIQINRYLEDSRISQVNF